MISPENFESTDSTREQKRIRSKRIYASILALALLALVVSQWAVKDFRIQHRIGISLEKDELGLFLAQCDPGLPADRAGLREKDRVLAVDGRPILTRPEYDEAAAGFHRGQPARFRIEREGKVSEVAVIPGVEFPWTEFLFNVAIVLLFFGLGLMAYLQVFYDIRKRLLYLFAFSVAFEFALPTETIGILGADLASNIAFYLISGFEFGVGLHLACSLPELYPWVARRRRIIPAFYAVGAVLGGWLSFSYMDDALSLGVLPAAWRGSTAVLDTALLPGLAAGMLLVLILQAARQKDALRRYQVYFVLLGIFPWVLTVAYSTYIFWANAPYPSWMNLVWPLALFPFPFTIFIAMFRYHMFDIQMVVRKGLVYSALTGSLLLIFYAALGAGSFFISHRMLGGKPSVWIFTGAALLLGLLIQPLKQIVQNKIDVRFFPERYALRQRLTTLAAELPLWGSLPRMGEHLAGQVREIFDLESAAVLMAGAGSDFYYLLAEAPRPKAGEESFLVDRDDSALKEILQLRRPAWTHRLRKLDSPFGRYLLGRRVELTLPMEAREVPVGLLMAGAKTAGRKFGREESELLNFLVRHAAVVFENARLFESATFDSLTGLLRREAVLERLRQELERAVRYDRPLTVAMCDLDFFKQVNDRFGHLEGDKALKRVAQTFSEGMRAADFVGRYGGDEFLLVLPETDIQNAREVAERVRELIQAVPFVSSTGTGYHLTISIGITTLAAGAEEEGSLVERLVGRADGALYKAKEGGRNSIQVVADPQDPLPTIS